MTSGDVGAVWCMGASGRSVRVGGGPVAGRVRALRMGESLLGLLRHRVIEPAVFAGYSRCGGRPI